MSQPLSHRALDRRLRLGSTMPGPWALGMALLLEAGLFGALLAWSIGQPLLAEARVRTARLESTFAEGHEAALDEAPVAEPAAPRATEIPEPVLELVPVPLPELEPVPSPDPIAEVDEADPEDEAWLEPLRPKPEPEPVVEAEASKPAATTRAKVEPIDGSCPDPEYPARALRLGQEGTMRLRLFVGADGTVSDIRVLEQRCSVQLLQAALTTLVTWRFRNGPGHFDQEVRFELK
ncbi:MAG: TonB family protein [Planctomycetota bacterium]